MKSMTAGPLDPSDVQVLSITIMITLRIYPYFFLVFLHVQKKSNMMIFLQWLPTLTQMVGLKADEQFWSSWTKLQNFKISPQMKISQIFTDRYNNTEKFKGLSNNTNGQC